MITVADPEIWRGGFIAVRVRKRAAQNPATTPPFHYPAQFVGGVNYLEDEAYQR